MNPKLKEFFAVIITLVILVGLPMAIFHYAPWKVENEIPVIHLTARMDGGVWTADEVNGVNYWWKDFTPSTLILEMNKEVIIRLSSSDVTHSFYVPELFPEPVIVKAGFTEEIKLKPQSEGEFTYYCTTICGECHYYMQGTIRVVLRMEENLQSENLSKSSICDHPIIPIPFDNIVENGKFIFENKGCITCHGKNGAGGIANPNYVNEFVPELNTIADRMKLFWKEDADTIIILLEEKEDLKSLTASPPFPGYNRFYAQYNSYRTKIINGAANLQKFEPDGPEPPLVMPSWKHQLTDEELDAVIAYLISEFPWREYE